MKQYVVDAFTDRVFHGNQAAVCVLDAWLPEERMMFTLGFYGKGDFYDMKGVVEEFFGQIGLHEIAEYDGAPDMVFVISVQGHGMYATDEPAEPYAITSTGLEDNPGLKNAFEYYVSQLKETDDFLARLTDELRAAIRSIIAEIEG